MESEQIEILETKIHEFLKDNKVNEARKISEKLHLLQKENKHKKVKGLKLQITHYMQDNNVDFRTFCRDFGLNVYYTQKIVDGLIEPSETYVETLLEMITK